MIKRRPSCMSVDMSDFARADYGRKLYMVHYVYHVEKSLLPVLSAIMEPLSCRNHDSDVRNNMNGLHHSVCH